MRCSVIGIPAAITMAFVALLSAAPTLPQTKTFCSEPVTPFCTNRETVFDDDLAREKCRDEVAGYVEELHEFVDCLGRQQQEARERAREIDERFACMARGDTDCR